MKKYKGMKITAIIGLVFLLLGAGCIGAGIVKGGSLRYLQVNSDTLSWWPFPNIGVGINTKLDYSKRQSYEEALQDVKSVEINADLGDITVKRGSSNRISYKTVKKEYVKIQNIDGYLTIDIDHPSKLNVNNKVTQLTLELSDALYERIFVDTQLGDLDILGVRTKALEVHLNLGDLDVKNIYSEGTNIDLSCGDLDVEGELLNETRIENDLGESDVKLRGNRDEYRYEVKNNLGDSEILGHENEFNCNMQGGNQGAKNHVVIENSLGDIEFDIR